MDSDQIRNPMMLSEHLATALREYEGVAPEWEPEEQREHREYVEGVRSSAKELEEFKLGPGFENVLTPELQDWCWKFMGDKFYSREVVEHLPDMVRQFSQLRPVLVGKLPDRQVAIYMREATRCFVYGLFQGSIALSRAALEAGLNRYIEFKLGAVPPMDLKDKIEKAAQFKLIRGETASLGQEVRRLSNQVLHSKPASENMAFDALVAARGVLQELYCV